MTRLVKKTMSLVQVIIAFCALFFAVEFGVIINHLYERCPTQSELCGTLPQCSCDKFDSMFKAFRGVLGVTYTVLDVSLIISYLFIKKAMQDQLAMGTRKDLNWMYFMLVLIFTLSTIYILSFG